jgi:hypothetical protein
MPKHTVYMWLVTHNTTAKAQCHRLQHVPHLQALELVWTEPVVEHSLLSEHYLDEECYLYEHQNALPPALPECSAVDYVATTRHLSLSVDVYKQCRKNIEMCQNQ